MFRDLQGLPPAHKYKRRVVSTLLAEVGKLQRRVNILLQVRYKKTKYYL